MIREDAEDFLKYFESHHGAHAVVSALPIWNPNRSNAHLLRFQKSNWFGPNLSLRYQVLEADDSWKIFERVIFGPSYDKFNAFGEMWDAMMSQAKSVSRQGYTFAFFPNDFDCINYVDGKKRVGETFTLPCVSSVAEMELKLAIAQ